MFDSNYLLSTSELLESSQVEKKEINNLKEQIKEKKTNTNNIKDTLLKIYRSDANSLATELPSIGEIIRLTITVGLPMSINPLFGIFTLIADRTIKDVADSKVISRYIKSYEHQIQTTEKEISKCKDKQQKKELQDHLNDLKHGLGNLESKKYELQDKEKGYAYSKTKEMSEKEINEAVNLMELEYMRLTETQKLLLLDDSIIVNESVIDKAKSELNAKAHDANAKVDEMDNWFAKTARTIKIGFTNNARDDVIEDNIPKFSKLVKRAIVLGAGWAVNPAIAVIGAVVAFGLSKKGKESQRKMILRDLNNELEMVEEKLKDADSNQDKDKKYELMRLKQTIQNSRDKIQRRVLV